MSQVLSFIKFFFEKKKELVYINESELLKGPKRDEKQIGDLIRSYSSVFNFDLVGRSGKKDRKPVQEPRYYLNLF